MCIRDISYGYKNWDISVFFQGLARESFWIDYNNVSPFFNTVDTKVVGVHCTKDNVVVDVPFVNVGGQHIRVFALQDLICKLPANFPPCSP